MKRITQEMLERAFAQWREENETEETKENDNVELD